MQLTSSPATHLSNQISRPNMSDLKTQFEAAAALVKTFTKDPVSAFSFIYAPVKRASL